MAAKDIETLDRLMRDLLAGHDPIETPRKLAAFGDAAVRAALDPGPWGPSPEGRDPRDLSDDLTRVLQLVAARDPKHLIDALAVRKDSAETILFALASSREPIAVDAPVSASSSRSAATRRRGVSGLGATGDPRALMPLLGALEDRDASVRMAAVDSLSRFHHPPKMRAAIDRFLTRENLGLGEHLYGGRIAATLAGPEGFDAIARESRRDLALSHEDSTSCHARNARVLADRIGRLGDRFIVWWSRAAPPHPVALRYIEAALPGPMDPDHRALVLETGCIRIAGPAGGPDWTFPGSVEGGAPWTHLVEQSRLRVPAGLALVPVAFREGDAETLGYRPDGQVVRWHPAGDPVAMDCPDVHHLIAQILEGLEVRVSTT